MIKNVTEEKVLSRSKSLTEISVTDNERPVSCKIFSLNITHSLENNPSFFLCICCYIIEKRNKLIATLVYWMHFEKLFCINYNKGNITCYVIYINNIDICKHKKFHRRRKLDDFMLPISIYIYILQEAYYNYDFILCF